MEPILIEDVHVFDGSGSRTFRGSVLVEGNRIVAVARHGEPITADGATRISGNGATLMPGMIEAHAHVTWPSAI